ncbi:MAG: ATP-binding cassette domain-containing protein [Chitinophagaceae bacterium]
MLQIQLHTISKQYETEKIIDQISLTFTQPEHVAIIGKNGSGKSTLLQIIAGFLTPTEGEIKYFDGTTEIPQTKIFHEIAYCAPYLELIEELTLLEFFDYHFSFKKSKSKVAEIINIVGLDDAKRKQIHHFSSGMKQRVKLAQSFFADTSILLLDEPTSNLDQEGIALYKLLLQNYGKERLVIIASNDTYEYETCNRIINLNHE